jgi:hypothetical protein
MAEVRVLLNLVSWYSVKPKGAESERVSGDWSLDPLRCFEGRNET